MTPVVAGACRTPKYTPSLRVAPIPPSGQERTGADRSGQVRTFKQAQIRYTGARGRETLRQLPSRQVLTSRVPQRRLDGAEVLAKQPGSPTR